MNSSPNRKSTKSRGVPAGEKSRWTRLPVRSPYTLHLGPVYQCTDAGARRFALRVRKDHTNLAGTAHGGFLMTFADLVLCWEMVEGRVTRRITVSVNCDFVGAAHAGEWLEADVVVQRRGRELSFVNANLHVEQRPVLHASGIVRDRRTDAVRG